MLTKRFDHEFLVGLGNEVARLLSTGDLEGLAERFGYMLAYDRTPVDALREELRAVLDQAGGASLTDDPPTIVVGRFEPDNDIDAFAVISCNVPLTDGAGFVLAELMVFGQGAEKQVLLEDVSYS